MGKTLGVIFFEGVFGLAVLVLWVYCIFDVISTDEALVQNLPKIIWLLVVIFIPTIGSIAWLLLGRPQKAGFTPGGQTYRAEPRSSGFARPGSSRATLAPDDDPRFLAQLDDRAKKLSAWEEDLKRREDELRRRDEGDESAG